MTRQRLDTKQEPKYTEPNKTQVDTMKLTRLKPLNETQVKTIGQGKTKTGGHGCGRDSTPLSRDIGDRDGL